MNEEEFFNRIINRIDKDYGYDVASTLKLMFIKKEKQLEAYENMRKEAINYLKEFGFYGFNKNWQDLLNILNKVGEDNENNN